MAYKGKERRRRFVYSTRNSDYHVMDGICVAIRDKITGDWIDDHAALRRPVEGGVRVFASGAAIPTLKPPRPGSPMYFHMDDEAEEQLITSTVVAVGRPDDDDLVRYPAA